MSDNKQYVTQNQENGTVMISEEVLAAIITRAASEVEGVVSLASKASSDILDVVGKKNWSKGLRVVIGQDNEVYVDCNIIVSFGQSVVQVAAAVQEAVSGALESMTGITVSAVNVNVCGIAK